MKTVVVTDEQNEWLKTWAKNIEGTKSTVLGLLIDYAMKNNSLALMDDIAETLRRHLKGLKEAE